MKILRSLSPTVALLTFSVLSVFLSGTMLGQFSNFVTAKGDKLMDGDRELRFVSYNLPNLHYIEDQLQFTESNPWRLSDEFEIRDALTAIKQAGGKVTRMYVFSVRKEMDDQRIPRHVEAPGKFNEEAFRVVDKVLQVANEVGVRVIIPFVDNWKWWGGPKEYAGFEGKKPSEFWTDSIVFADYQKTVEFVINRVNTFTGIRYKDDKAILGWETGNELEPTSYEWTRKAASFIKSLDTNHLVIEGTFLMDLRTEALNDPNIDVLSTHHYWPMNVMIEKITKNRALAKGKKPYFVGEFGFIPTEHMKAILDTVINTGISGIMVWSMRFHNRDGGFYYHENAYRWPGFESGTPWEEIKVVDLFRDRSARISREKIEPIPVPRPPSLLPITTPFKISWQGSTGASAYILERREEDNGVWKTIAENLTDADIGYRPLYADNSVNVGKNYYYRLKAKNESGISAVSAPIGPVHVDCLMMIDEMENGERYYGKMGYLQYLTRQDLAKVKEDRNRVAGKDGDYIVYKIPDIISSFQLDAFAVGSKAKDIAIFTGETPESFKPLEMKKIIYTPFPNEYGMFVPIRYNSSAIPERDRFVKIMLNSTMQVGRVEVEYHRGVFSLAPILADSMVLQRQRKVPFWGEGIAGATVTITPSWGKGVKTKVLPTGDWIAHLQMPKAGGPHTITIVHGDSTTVLRNVLIGDVWLASGQSNMEMPLAGWPPSDTIEGSPQEIAGAHYPDIRFCTVAKNYSTTPLSTCISAWRPCTPQTASQFSATAFFFAKAMHRALKTPIGIIHSSWGGTAIESWMSAEALSHFDEYRRTLKQIDESKDSVKKITQWLTSLPVIDMSRRNGEGKWMGLAFGDTQCASPLYNDHRWKDMILPTVWEKTEVGNFDGIIWFRRTVDIPAAWLHKKLILELGPIDDMDITYVNDIKIGSYEKEGFWKTDRVYALPDSLVQSTRVSIAVRVMDIQGGGGIFGDAKQMQLHPDGSSESVPLAGAWKYLPVAEYRNGVFYVAGADSERYFARPRLAIDPSAYTPTALFNAMINPLCPFALKGMIWYQGESNTGQHTMYAKLFPAMIGDWRKRFQSGNAPFYFVQIAPYKYDGGTHSEFLREAQCSALSLRNTGMATTLDIGDVRNIHPTKKKEVGERLAALALANARGVTTSVLGPSCISHRVENDKYVLTFSNAGKGLSVKSHDGENEFQIAGNDHVFKSAQVEAKGNTVIVFHPGIKKPVAVRYAFTDTSTATLFSADGVPAPPLRTDTWK